MKISAVRIAYSRRKNLGNYEHAELKLEYEIVADDGDNIEREQIENEFNDIRAFVHGKLLEAGTGRNAR